MREISFQQALTEALREEMIADEDVFLMGEDIGVYGGARGVTEGLIDEFGEKRVRDTPLSETAIIGAGTGAAVSGMRPVCELMLMGFTAVCFDEIQNLAGKWPYIHGHEDEIDVPLVIRGPAGITDGGVEPHAQSPESFFLHTPGVKVVLPYTPYDAKGLLKAAIRDDNPVVFFEHGSLYDTEGPVPEEDYTVPLGEAAVRREGEDLTLIGVSSLVGQAMEVAETLSDLENLEAEVIDLRTLDPLDEETLLSSVRKTGKVMLLQEAYRSGGYAAEVTAVIAEKAATALQAPVVRIAPQDHPIPYSPALKEAYQPSSEDIVKRATKLAG